MDQGKSKERIDLEKKMRKALEYDLADFCRREVHDRIFEQRLVHDDIVPRIMEVMEKLGATFPVPS